jgi:hypothetical protein
MSDLQISFNQTSCELDDLRERRDVLRAQPYSTLSTDELRKLSNDITLRVARKAALLAEMRKEKSLVDHVVATHQALEDSSLKVGLTMSGLPDAAMCAEFGGTKFLQLGLCVNVGAVPGHARVDHVLEGLQHGEKTELAAEIDRPLPASDEEVMANSKRFNASFSRFVFTLLERLATK